MKPQLTHGRAAPPPPPPAYVCRIWREHDDGSVDGRTYTYALPTSDMRPAVRRWGEPVGWVFGSGLDLWEIGPAAAVLIYPRDDYRAGFAADLAAAGIAYAVPFPRPDGRDAFLHKLIVPIAAAPAPPTEREA